MNPSNQQRLNKQILEYTLKEKPLSLSCIVARNLIEQRMSEHEIKNIIPKDLLIGTPLEFTHAFFFLKDALQSAIAQSKHIHPNIRTTLHAKIRGTIKCDTDSGSITTTTETNYIGNRKLISKAHVMWSKEDRIVDLCIDTQGGLPPPSVVSNYIAKVKETYSLSGTMISLKFQSQTGLTNIGLEDEVLVHDGVIGESEHDEVFVLDGTIGESHEILLDVIINESLQTRAIIRLEREVLAHDGVIEESEDEVFVDNGMVFPSEEGLLHAGKTDKSLQTQPINEWIQFRPLWKIDGISNAEVETYLYTCTQIVYNRLIDVYNKNGTFEASVPHLLGKVAADSTMIESYSCPCNIFKCRGLRDVLGAYTGICPFMGHQLHPRGFISSI